MKGKVFCSLHGLGGYLHGNNMSSRYPYGRSCLNFWRVSARFRGVRMHEKQLKTAVYSYIFSIPTDPLKENWHSCSWKRELANTHCTLDEPYYMLIQHPIPKHWDWRTYVKLCDCKAELPPQLQPFTFLPSAHPDVFLIWRGLGKWVPVSGNTHFLSMYPSISKNTEQDAGQSLQKLPFN